MSQRPDRDWRAAATAPPGAGASKKLPLFLAGLAATALAGSIIGLLYYLLVGEDSNPKYVGLPLYAYSNPAWPPVPFAEADARRIGLCFKGQEPSLNSQEDKLFRAALTGLERSEKRPLVLYITGLAVVRDGEIFLLSSRAEPAKPGDKAKLSNWHPFQDVLDAVGKSPAKNKLVILDLAHPVADPANGVLADTVSTVLYERLDKLKRSQELPATFLISAGKGEFSLPLAEEGMTAFGFYLQEGLRGAADGFLNDAPDQWVKVQELAAFVADRVPRWAARTRGAAQKPYTVGDADFRLTTYSGSFDRGAADSAKPLVFPKAIKAGWEQRDQWLAAPQRDLGAHLIRELESRLLRAEAEHRAGQSDAVVAQDLGQVVARLKDDWSKLKDVVPPPALVALATPVSKPLELKMGNWLASPDVKKQKFAQVKGDLNPKADELAAEVARRLRFKAVDYEILIALTEAGAPPGAPIENSEAVFFDKLRTLALSRVFAINDRPWPKATIHAAVEAELRYLEALSQMTPQAFPWFRDRFNALARLRHETETLLWTIGNEKLPDWQATFDKVTEGYQRVAKDAETLRDAAKAAARAQPAVLDALPRLAGYGSWLMQRPLDDATGAWNEAARAAAMLADANGNRDPAAFDAAKLATQVANLQSALAKLQSLLVEQMRRDPFARDADAVLAAPRLVVEPVKDQTDAKDREKYWNRWRLWCADEYAALRKDEWETSGGGGRGKAIPPADETKRAADRARVALDLARLAGADITALQREYDQLRERGTAAAWNTLGAKVPALTRVETGDTSDRANRTGRVFGTSATPAKSAGQLKRDYWRWLVERYTEDRLRRDPAAADFYKTAIDAAKAAADRADAASR